MFIRTLMAALIIVLLSTPSMAQTMIASWYGPGFQGLKMANGNRFNMYAPTVAHKTWPLGARVCITSLVNGRKVHAYITDRGPYKPHRDIDLSYALAQVLGIIPKGTGPVDVELC